MVHVSTTQVNCCSIKAAINYIVNESSSVPMKPYCTYWSNHFTITFVHFNTALLIMNRTSRQISKGNRGLY